MQRTMKHVDICLSVLPCLFSGATQLSSALATALETVKSNSVQAMQQQNALPGPSNLHDSRLSNRVAEPAVGQNRKQQQGYARLPAHQQPGSGTPFSSDGTDSSGSDRAVRAFEQQGHSSMDQRLQQATHKHALDVGGNGMQEPAALVWGKKQKRRRASPAESHPADSHASKAHPASARVNRVSQGQQQSNPRQVLASLPANQMREGEPQGICTVCEELLLSMVILMCMHIIHCKLYHFVLQVCHLWICILIMS